MVGMASDEVFERIKPGHVSPNVRESTMPPPLKGWPGTNGKLTLLHCEMGAGHGGASGRYDALKEVARDDAFLLSALGLQDK
jgi:hypothetical protein